MRPINVASSVVLLALGLTACSGTSNPTSSSSSGSGTSAISSASSSPEPVTTGEATLMLGTMQFTPKTVTGSAASTFAGQSGAIDSTGVLVKGAAGSTFKPAELKHQATIIWMSDKYVLGTQDINTCQGSCSALKAPANTTQVLLIRADKVTEIAADTAVTKG